MSDIQKIRTAFMREVLGKLALMNSKETRMSDGGVKTNWTVKPVSMTKDWLMPGLVTAVDRLAEPLTETDDGLPHNWRARCGTGEELA